MARLQRRQVVIVGGGLLGLITAALAMESGYKDVIVYDQPGPLNLGSDSLRCHGWLHSGLLYESRPSSQIMFNSGRRMLQRFGIAPPVTRGVFGVATEKEEVALLARSERLNLREHVRRLQNDECRTACGVFFRRGARYFEVPDAPVDFGAVLRRAYDIAHSEGAQLMVDNVSLEDHSGRVAVCTGAGRIMPTHLIVTAGAGIPTLLRPLGLDVPLSLYRSSLLVINDAGLLPVPLLADLRSKSNQAGLAVLRHVRSDAAGESCLVVGSRLRYPVSINKMPKRETSVEEQRHFESLLPPHVYGMLNECGARYTAGIKAELTTSQGHSGCEAWVYRPQPYPNLTVAIPGKATLALFAAEHAVSGLGKPRPLRRSSQSQSATSQPLLRYMHYEARFNNILNDAPRPNGVE
jgi:hypothetical protein